jgi:NitT/TauT family transport system substrate-binding protein
MTACANGGKEVAADTEGVRHLRIALPFVSTLNSGLLIAQGKGYFKERNIEVEFTEVANGAGLQTTLGGSADIAVTSGVQPLTALDQGQKFTVFGRIGNGFPETIIVSATAWKESGLNDKSPLVDKIKFLAGKPFGVTSPTGSSSYVLHYLFKLAGVPDDQLKLVSLGSPAGTLAALKSGKVIGGSMGSPFPQVAEAEGYAKTFINVTGGEVPEVHNILTSVLAVTPEFYAKNTALLKDFKEVLRKGQAFAYANPTECDEYVYTTYFATSPKDAVLKGVAQQREGGAIAQVPEIDEESALHLVTFMKATGQKVPDTWREIFVDLNK